MIKLDPDNVAIVLPETLKVTGRLELAVPLRLTTVPFGLYVMVDDANVKLMV